MVKIVEKKDCCGCTACSNACPCNAISMHQDEEGFFYPIIDNEKCAECNMCKKVCPILNNESVKSHITQANIIQIKDEKILFDSASGGFFYALCQYVMEQSGVVYGAAYTDGLDVVHCEADNIDQCRAFSGSKYVQSWLGDTYSRIKGRLLEGKLVCFSGTPCQVHGLKKYLGDSYENLITVDLVCAGVPSPKLWRKYLDWQEERHGAAVINANFRNKTYGYHCSTLKLEFDDGQIYSKSGRIDPMMKAFVSGVAKRPSCYKCSFKGLDRCSDFTLFDGWNAYKLTGEKDDGKGFTSVLVHTTKAVAIFNSLNEKIKYSKIDLDRAISYDGVMIYNQPERHPGREDFYSILNENGIEGCVKKYLENRKVDYVIEFLKPFLYRLGIINMVKNIKKILVR